MTRPGAALVLFFGLGLAQGSWANPIFQPAQGGPKAGTEQDATDEVEPDPEERPQSGDFLQEPVPEDGGQETGETNPVGACCMAGSCLTFSSGAGTLVGAAVGAAVGVVAGVVGGLIFASQSPDGQSGDPARTVSAYALFGGAGAVVGAVAGLAVGAGGGFLVGATGGVLSMGCALCGDGDAAEGDGDEDGDADEDGPEKPSAPPPAQPESEIPPESDAPEAPEEPQPVGLHMAY
jgi:hypothetical protein